MWRFFSKISTSISLKPLIISPQDEVIYHTNSMTPNWYKMPIRKRIASKATVSKTLRLHSAIFIELLYYFKIFLDVSKDIAKNIKYFMCVCEFFFFSTKYFWNWSLSRYSIIFIFLSNIFFVAHINEIIDKILGYLKIIYLKIINYSIEKEYDVSVAFYS